MHAQRLNCGCRHRSLPADAWAGRLRFLLLFLALLPVSAAPVSAFDDPAPPAGDAAAETAPAPAPGSETASESKPAAPQYAGPLMTAAEEENWRRNHSLKFTKAKANTRLSAADEAELALGVKYHLHKLTMEEHRENLPKVAQQFLDDLRRSSKPARDFMMDQALKLASTMLDQPPLVRMNVMILVASLDADPGANPPVPYVEASKLLASVLNDPRQLLDSKLWAVQGLGRICEDTDPPVVVRNEAASAMVSELTSGSSQVRDNAWYRRVLIQGLGRTGLLLDITRRPVIIDTLMGYLTDPKEPALIRATAARSISQLPFQPDTNVPLINYEIAKLAHDSAVAYNQNMKPANWRWTFANLYFAYRPQLRQQMESRRWGLSAQVQSRPGLAQHQPAVQEAYNLIVPLMNTVLIEPPQPIPAQAVEALSAWLKQNEPANRKVTPDSKELPKAASGAPDPMI